MQYQRYQKRKISSSGRRVENVYISIVRLTVQMPMAGCIFFLFKTYALVGGVIANL